MKIYAVFCPSGFYSAEANTLTRYKKTLFFIPSLFTFLTEPDMVVVNIFKNNAASCSKEMEENSLKGKKWLWSESMSIVSKVYRVKRQVRTNKSTGTWITVVKNLQCVLLTHHARPHPDHTAKKPRNCGGTSSLQKADGHLILMEMSTLYITQCILFVRLEQKP